MENLVIGVTRSNMKGAALFPHGTGNVRSSTTDEEGKARPLVALFHSVL